MYTSSKFKLKVVKTSIPRVRRISQNVIEIMLNKINVGIANNYHVMKNTNQFNTFICIFYTNLKVLHNFNAYFDLKLCF